MKTFKEECRELMQWFVEEDKKLEKSIITKPITLSNVEEYDIAFTELVKEKNRRLRLLEEKHGEKAKYL